MNVCEQPHPTRPAILCFCFNNVYGSALQCGVPDNDRHAPLGGKWVPAPANFPKQLSLGHFGALAPLVGWNSTTRPQKLTPGSKLPPTPGPQGGGG